MVIEMLKLKCIGTGSSGNCYILEENDQLVILDVGIRMADIKKGIGYRVSDIVTVFTSHGHQDHSKSEEKFVNMGADIFAPYHSENLTQTHKNKGWYFKSFDLPHGDCPNTGIYIMSPDGHKLVYMTDFQHCAYKFTKLHINTFLIACNHMDDIDKEANEGKFAHTIRDHSSLSVVKEFLRVNKTDRLQSVILCHLSPDNAQPSVMLQEVQEVVGDNVRCYIAKKGQVIELDE